MVHEGGVLRNSNRSPATALSRRNSDAWLTCSGAICGSKQRHNGGEQQSARCFVGLGTAGSRSQSVAVAKQPARCRGRVWCCCCGPHYDGIAAVEGA